MYYDVPTSLSPLFVGRQDLLRDLVTYLSPPSEIQKRVIISGMGGMGKTQLAVRVASELRTLFHGVFWINASSSELIKAGWANIAHYFGPETNYRAGIHCLTSLRKPWLLIMDNAE